MMTLVAHGLFGQAIPGPGPGANLLSPGVNLLSPGANLLSPGANALVPATGQPADDRPILAMATADYPVTPGDVYRLDYVYSSGPFAILASVDSDYRVNLSLFGAVDARGLTLTQLRQRVEQMVLRTYPGSGPQLSVESVGVFEVYVKGEVTSSDWVHGWGLSRLSSLIAGRLTPYSSNRDVEIVSAAGAGKTYDLFLASRSGRKELDPYVGPNDTIVVHRRAREVTVVGEVERPGTYQLLEGEDLQALLQSYCGGGTRLADTAHLQITRWDSAEGETARTLYVDAGSQPAHVELRDLDTVRVPSLKLRLPIVFFEGAILPAEGVPDAGGGTFNRIRYTFVEGEMLSSAVTALYEKFETGSDIESAFVVRDDTGEKIPVDIRRLVHGGDASKDLPLQPFDRIVIPYRKYAVTVSGAVARPGEYPYVPDRGWRYYVALAGGFDPTKHVGDDLVITDARDKSQPQSRTIEAEDKILVPANNVLYFSAPVVQVVGVVATVATAIATVLILLK
jgi:polysaccharide biosynthesis/export protein